MPTLLVALALGQLPPRPLPLADPAFTLAVESWVVAHRRPGTTIAVVVGREASDALVALGSDKAAVRRLGWAALMRQPAVVRRRALAWGMGHRDPEVRGACRAMWNTLYVCEHCGNTKVCPVWRDYEDRECPIDDRSGGCHACGP